MLLNEGLRKTLIGGLVRPGTQRLILQMQSDVFHRENRWRLKNSTLSRRRCSGPVPRGLTGAMITATHTGAAVVVFYRKGTRERVQKRAEESERGTGVG
jgi:hypothetical protein